MQWLTSSLHCHAEQDQEGETHQICNQQKWVRTLCLPKKSFCNKIAITQIVIITKKLVFAKNVAFAKNIVIEKKLKQMNEHKLCSPVVHEMLQSLC